MRLFITSLAVTGLSFSFIAQSQAAVTAVSNLGVSGTQDSQLFGQSESVAISFTTGSSATTFESLQFISAGATPATGTVALYDANGSDPGTLLLTMDIDTAGADGDIITVSGTYQFSATTTYFAVFEGPTDRNMKAIDNTTETSPVGWTIADTSRVNKDDGKGWAAGTPNLPIQIAINVTAVPEPSSVALLGLGSLALLLRRRW